MKMHRSQVMTRPERLSEIDQAAEDAAKVSEVEGDIREFVRRDVSVFRRPRQDNSEPANEISALIQRVSAASVAEIERVMAELTLVRDMLRNEGERVQREIAGYANLSQAAMTSMKIIAESLSQWKPHSNQQRQSNG
jgi:hypothetical protein